MYWKTKCLQLKNGRFLTGFRGGLISPFHSCYLRSARLSLFNIFLWKRFIWLQLNFFYCPNFQADNFSVVGGAAALPDDRDSIDSRSSPGSVQPSPAFGASAEALPPLPGPSGLGRSAGASMPVGASANALAHQVINALLWNHCFATSTSDSLRASLSWTVYKFVIFDKAIWVQCNSVGKRNSPLQLTWSLRVSI